DILWTFDLNYPNGRAYSTSLFTGQSCFVRMLGKQYASSGNFISRTFDTSFATSTWLWGWSTFTATGYIPSRTTLTYETQTSSSATGAFDSLISVSSGSNPSSAVREFIRYKASFTATDLSTSPVLNDVSINMTQRLRPQATFYSAVKNAPSISSWDTFSVTRQTNGGTHSFFMRSSTNSISVTSSTPSWTSVTAGAVPALSTGTYFQVQDNISVS